MGTYQHHPDGWVRITGESAEYRASLAELEHDSGSAAPALPSGMVRRYYNEREGRHLVSCGASEHVAEYPHAGIAALIARADELAATGEARRAEEQAQREAEEQARLDAEEREINERVARELEEANRAEEERVAAEEEARRQAESEGEEESAEP